MTYQPTPAPPLPTRPPPKPTVQLRTTLYDRLPVAPRRGLRLAEAIPGVCGEVDGRRALEALEADGLVERDGVYWRRPAPMDDTDTDTDGEGCPTATEEGESSSVATSPECAAGTDAEPPPVSPTSAAPGGPPPGLTSVQEETWHLVADHPGLDIEQLADLAGATRTVMSSRLQLVRRRGALRREIGQGRRSIWYPAGGETAEPVTEDAGPAARRAPSPEPEWPAADTRVDELDLPVRCALLLEELGIRTAGEARACSDRRLLRHRRGTTRALEDIREVCGPVEPEAHYRDIASELAEAIVDAAGLDAPGPTVLTSPLLEAVRELGVRASTHDPELVERLQLAEAKVEQLAVRLAGETKARFNVRAALFDALGFDDDEPDEDIYALIAHVRRIVERQDDHTTEAWERVQRAIETRERQLSDIGDALGLVGSGDDLVAAVRALVAVAQHEQRRMGEASPALAALASRTGVPVAAGPDAVMGGALALLEQL